MTRRIAITPAGLFIARPGNDALDATKPRLVEPRYRMLEQHARGSVLSSVRTHRGNYSHTATITFPPLPYVPIVQFTVNELFFLPVARLINRANRVTYPNYVSSQFGVSVTRSSITCEGILEVGLPVLFNATIMKADSGLPG